MKHTLVFYINNFPPVVYIHTLGLYTMHYLREQVSADFEDVDLAGINFSDFQLV